MIREYRESDWPAVRDICAQTALYGRPIEPLLDDRELVAAALLGSYVRYERGCFLVEDSKGRIEGYLAGCPDTRRFMRLFTLRALPGLCIRFVARGTVLCPAAWRIIAAIASGARRRHRLISAAEYPAHCHINVISAARRSGTGARLLEEFLRRLRALGVRGVHVSASSEAGKRFFAKMGFAVVAAYPVPPLGGIRPGEAWLMGKKLAGQSQALAAEKEQERYTEGRR